MNIRACYQGVESELDFSRFEARSLLCAIINKTCIIKNCKLSKDKAKTVVESLPLVIFTLMLEISCGTFLVLLPTDFAGETGRNFLVTCGLTSLATAGLARLTQGTVDFGLGLQTYPADAAWAGFQDFCLTLLIIALVIYNLMVWVGTDRARRVVGILAAVAAVLTLFADAMLYRGTYLGGWIAPFSFFAGAAAVGSVMTGMLLGHWYLVTPTMSVAPLNRINTFFFWSLIAQAVLVIINAGPWANSGALFQNFTVIFWLRVLVGIAFPIVLAIATWQTCKLKAHMSSTGFLYVALAAVLAGEIISKVILFSVFVPL